jgi:hypothetical protein
MRHTRRLIKVAVPMFGLSLALAAIEAPAEATGAEPSGAVATGLSRQSPRSSAFWEGYRDGRNDACGKRGHHPRSRPGGGSYAHRYELDYRRGYAVGRRAGCPR